MSIGGRFNYTGPVNQYNDENLFIIRNAQVPSTSRRKSIGSFNT